MMVNGEMIGDFLKQNIALLPISVIIVGHREKCLAFILRERRFASASGNQK